MRRTFTLIELLVVIAIIAILAAILFPVFAQAREKARAASCLSNQKQIATGLLMYTQDYDEMLLMGMWGGSASGTLCSWPAMIQPYIKNTNVFQCPTAPRTAGITAGTIAATNGCGIGTGFVVTYAYNYYLGGNNSSTGVATSSLPAMERPAETVLIVDGASTAQNAAFGSSDLWPEKRTSSATPVGGTTTANRYPYLLIHSGSSLMASANDYGAPRGRHNGMTNVIWADGHVKARKLSADFYPPVGDNRYQALCTPVLTGTGIAAASCAPCLLPQLGCQP
jgi:prepilin-type N-terminal cleavage/methylation domain-containing protein/prepilin-type processing-associated H-X9-DG protein